jgi:hypothetical protein
MTWVSANFSNTLFVTNSYGKKVWSESQRTGKTFEYISNETLIYDNLVGVYMRKVHNRKESLKKTTFSNYNKHLNLLTDFQVL